MPKATPEIQPIIFVPTDPDPEPVLLWSLAFPNAWVPAIHRLQQEVAGREDEPVSVPIRSLNAVLRALVAPLATLPGDTKARRDGSTPAWLLARQPIDPGLIWLIVQAWLDQQYRACPSYPQVRPTMGEADLAWVEHLVDWRGASPGAHTADPADRHAWLALPLLLADRLTAAGATLRVRDEQRRLIRVPVDEGAELMTWPPVYHTDRRGQWGYSYTVRITAQSVIGDPQLRIHLGFGIRRWVSFLLGGKPAYLGPTARSVFLHPTQPWLQQDASSMATVARLKAAREGDEWVARWESPVAAIANRLQGHFPAARDLHARPETWIRGVDGVEAAMVHLHQQGHPVSPGLDLQTREELARALEPFLEPEWELIAPHRRVPMPASPPRGKHPLTEHLRDVPAERRLQGLVDSVGSKVTIEVYATSDALRDMVADQVHAWLTRSRPQPVEAAAEELGSGTGALPAGEATTGGAVVIQAGASAAGVGSAGGQQGAQRRRPRARAAEPVPERAPDREEIALPGGRLRIIQRSLGSLADPLPRDQAEQWSGHKRVARTQERAAAILNALGQAEEPTLAIVELPHYQDPAQRALRAQFRLVDPKIAIRLGMAKAGRVTQFITPPLVEDGPRAPRRGGVDVALDLRHRSGNAVLDGLRQLGYLPAPLADPGRFGRTIPQDLLVVAVRLLRLTDRRNWQQRIYVPCAVLIDAQRSKVWAWLPDGGPIRPYREALLAVALMDPAFARRKNWGEALRQLRNFIMYGLPREGPHDRVVLAEAQNIRSLWKSLGNPKIVWDTVQFADDQPPDAVADLDGALRVVRLRTHEREETPDWFSPGAGPASAPTGLWADPESADRRLFFSTGKKPHTIAGPRQGKQVRPTEHFAIPALLEIVPVALQPGDSPRAWVQVVDSWRQMAFLAPDGTLLPWPMHLAAKMDEYAEVIGPWSWSDVESVGEAEESNESEVDGDA